MKNITDRELLAFCSLAKLKLEFSEYKKVKVNDDNSETEEYKTIRQLLDLEIEGQHNRKGVKYEDKLRGELEEELEAAKKNLIKTKEEKAKYEEHMKSIDILEKERVELNNKKPKFESDVFSKRLSEAERLKNNYMAALDYNRSDVWPNLDKIRNYLSYLGKIKSSDGVLPMDYEHELEFLKLQKADVESLIKDEISRNDRPVDKNYISQKTSELEKIKSEMNPIELEKKKIDAMQKEIDNKISENVPNITEDDVSRAEENIRQREAALIEHEKTMENHVNDGNNMGVFYRKIDDEPIEFLYNDVNELRVASPLLMAYYDIRPRNDRNKFLEEWEVIFAGDSYEIGKVIYEDNQAGKKKYYEECKKIINSNEDDPKSKTILLENIQTQLSNIELEKYVTREELKKLQTIKFWVETGVQVGTVLTVGAGYAGKDIVGSYLAKVGIFKSAYVVLFADLVYLISDGKLGFPIFSTGTLAEKLMNKYIVEGLPDPSFTLDDVPQLGMPIEFNANFLNDALERLKSHEKLVIKEHGFRVVLLKNNINSEYVLAIENFKDDIRVQVDNGILPDEITLLMMFINIIKNKRTNIDKKEISLTYTGVEDGGILSLISGVVCSGSKDKQTNTLKGFFEVKPNYIPPAFAFTETNIRGLYEDSGAYNHGKINAKYKKSFAMNTLSYLSGRAFIARGIAVAATAEAAAFATPALYVTIAIIVGNIAYTEINTYLEEKNLEKIINMLKSENIIDSSNRVIEDSFKRRYPIAGLTGDFELGVYIQFKLIYETSDIFFMHSALNPNRIFGTKIVNSSIEVTDIELKDGKIKKIKKFLISNDDSDFNGLGDFRKLSFEEILYLLPNEEQQLSAIDIGGVFITNLLEYFNIIQNNYNKSNLMGVHFEDEKFTAKFENLEYSNIPQKNYTSVAERISNIKIDYYSIPPTEEKNIEKEIEKTKAIIPHSYIAFINEKTGMIKKTPQIAAIGYALATSFQNKNPAHSKYFDQSENYVEVNDIIFLESKEKGDTINKYLRGRIEEMKYLPNYVAIIAELDRTGNKILEECYEIIEDNEYFGFLYIGNLDSKNNSDKSLPAHSYDINDIRIPRATLVSVYFDKQMMGITEIATTKVLNGAELRCTAGSSPLKLIVTSQDFVYIEDELEATENDYKKLENIVPQGTSCSLRKNEPCMNFISTEKWQECSIGEDIEDQLILISSSTCQCACGGVITITDSKCDFIFSN